MSQIRIRMLAGAAALLGAFALAGPAHASGTETGPAGSQGAHHTSVGTEADAAASTGIRVPAAATGERTPDGSRHVAIGRQRVPDGTAHAGIANAGTYRASFTINGHTSKVQMNVFTGNDGHDWAWGEAWLYGDGEALYLDVWRPGQASWDPWQDYQVPSGVHTSTSTAYYDGPGYRIRACGANPNFGDPYGNPQWGWNIACSVWN
ncbi:hypothetical protein [Streptomyces sp. NPDC059533]|uniref:hypothetical protein n=2 Tax=unclassified Streptomyces TaxID=2593676 RepID=UPI00369399CC